jgi:hypothetical protein
MAWRLGIKPMRAMVARAAARSEHAIIVAENWSYQSRFREKRVALSFGPRWSAVALRRKVSDIGRELAGTSQAAIPCGRAVDRGHQACAEDGLLTRCAPGWDACRFLSLAALLLVPPAAVAAEPAGDVFSSSDAPCFAVCGAENWFASQAAENQAKAADCRGLLERARAIETKALEIRFSDRFAERVDEFNALIKQRSEALRAFADCATRAWRRRPGDDDGDGGGGDTFASGGDDGDKGITRSDCDDAAAKGIVRDDCDDSEETQPPEGPSPTTAALPPAIDDCLREGGITYYRSPATAAADGGVGYDPAGGRVRYDAAFLDGLPPYARSFWLADAYAAHVLDLERQRFGVRRTPDNARRARDYLTGYVVHCLASKGVLPPARNRSPDDPRIQYRRYLQRGGFAQPGDPPRNPRDIADWQRGWWEYGMGVIFSLRHDPALPPTPSDPYQP